MSLWTDLGVAAPIWVLAAGAGVVLLLTVAGAAGRAPAASPGATGAHLAILSLVTLLTSAGLLWERAGTERWVAFGGAIVVDGVSVIFGLIGLVAAAVAVVFAETHLREHEQSRGEFMVLVLLSSAGVLILAMAGDLMTLFIGIEVMSLGAYVLAGYRRSSRRSQEAALKYFIYGAFASAFVLFGIALTYGEVGRLTGTPALGMRAVASAYATPSAVSLLGWAAVALVLSGLCFKVAAVPFHMWAPDVYEGAPTPSTGFMAVGIKAAAFAALCRFVSATLILGGEGGTETAVQIFEVLAVATIVVGNLVAVRQRQIKRMLAYSSVAHAGYVMVGVAAFVANPGGSAITSIGYYLLGYAGMTLGAFGIVLAFERREDRRLDVGIDRLAGVGHTYPGLGLAMALFMFSLAGVPPTAGFFGKLSLFAAAVEAGRVSVVVIAALASVVGAYYYLRVLVVMYMQAQGSEERRVRSPWLAAGLWACVVLTTVAGILPEVVLNVVRQALGAWRG